MRINRRYSFSLAVAISIEPLIKLCNRETNVSDFSVCFARCNPYGMSREIERDRITRFYGNRTNDRRGNVVLLK